MGLTGKMTGQTEIKSDGDVFHEIYRDRPHHITSMSPDKVQGADIHEGEWGTVGSIIVWNYTLKGKAKVSKQVVEAIDEENKSITFKVIEGHVLELYKTFIINVHVDTKGEINLVTWTFKYEKQNENVEDPNSLMDLCILVSKDIEAHHL